MRKEICLGGRVLVYEFTRKRVKNCNLRIRDDGSVAVSAPPRMPMEQVEGFLQQKQEFIWKAVGRMETQRAPRAAADGQEIPYLGAALRLHFEQGRRYGAQRTEGELYLTLPRADEEERRLAALERWEKEECRRVMTAALERVYPPFVSYGVPKPTLRFRSMRSRWGSCMPRKGVVTLNTQLLAHPLECGEYILIHELCHFLQADHSAKFYEWMDRFLPDWRERKQKLNQGK
ncbi:MAG: M48 family metallopeptidase [Oscillospiraceae bacterium]|nr:M48 family metallopeptidase [Oscillospiraceae bacterium]